MNHFDDDTEPDDDTPELAAVLGAHMTGRFRAALREYLEGLDYGAMPPEVVRMRADGLARACLRADEPVLGVAVLLLLALRAAGGRAAAGTSGPARPTVVAARSEQEETKGPAGPAPERVRNYEAERERRRAKEAERKEAAIAGT